MTLRPKPTAKSEVIIVNKEEGGKDKSWDTRGVLPPLE